MGKRLLEVKDLKTYFYKEDTIIKAVDGVNFHVDEKETLGLVGESGCGKSMTSLSILRLIPKPAGRIVSGEVLFEGQDLLKLSEKKMRDVRGEQISMILQDPMTSLNPVFKIGNQIGEAIATHKEGRKGTLTSKIIEILRLVRIPSPETRIDNYPHELSGGMKQRVVGAVAISCRPRLLIADEPTTSLDVTIQAQYLELLKDIQRELGMALIFITHDFGIVASICDRVAVMYAGKIMEIAPVRDIFHDPAHHYTASLLKAVPKLQKKVDHLVSIPGQPPRLDSLPAGCRFAARCESADKKCKTKEPPMQEVGKNHYAMCWHQLH
ncbi:MAG: ABC transporter ATP-binding protein [Deltaproteobacteria bacterium]|nr:ABC transporter ATP-binding protein [Deltaproteobacteria bacterium]